MRIYILFKPSIECAGNNRADCGGSSAVGAVSGAPGTRAISKKRWVAPVGGFPVAHVGGG